MKKPTGLMINPEEDPSDSTSNQAFLDEPDSPSFNDNDDDGLSTDSKKIRKKRNAYCKISDDIRVSLLDAVKNGETLKSAAKRYKINYSSAKSILHTFRKEGRILKKSAQERTMKKKGGASMDSEENTKVVKPAKKENAKTNETTNKYPETMAPLSERINSVSTAASLSDKNNSSSEKVADSHKVNEYTHETVQQFEEPAMKMMHHEDMHDMNNQKIHHFDNYHHHQNYSDNYLHDPMGGDFHNFSNNMHYPSEFDLFNDTISSFKRKLSIDDFFHDPSGSLGNKDFNTPYAGDDKHLKFEGGMHHDTYGENAHCPLKSFMDTQNLLRQALRKASFASNNGSHAGYRRGSFDWMRKNSFDMF